MRRTAWLALLLLTAGSAGHAQKAGEAQPLPAPVQRLIGCRAIADASARLACFDKEAGTVAEAVTKRDLVVVDREGIQKTRRTLFGLPIPKLGVFDNDGEELSEIEGTVDVVTFNSDGGYVFILKDGGRWSQIDSRTIAVEPRVGDKVRVKRATFGSYMLSVAGQPGVRVKRVL